MEKKGGEVMMEEEIREFMQKTFKEDSRLMIAVCTAESHLSEKAIHQNSDGSTDYGVCQINSVHKGRVGGYAERLLDAKTNIEVAYQIFKEQGANPWVQYQNGSYKKYL